jgi:hypothetical protein
LVHRRKSSTGSRAIGPRFIIWCWALIAFLPASTLYALGLRLFHTRRAATGVIAAYATVGLVLFQSTHVRGYIMAIALFPVAFWFSIRFFETVKPHWSRAMSLAISLVLLFYTTYSAVPGFFLLGLFTLIAFPIRRSWRWLLPMLLALPLVAPQLWTLAQYMLPTLERRATTNAVASDFALEPYTIYQWVLLQNYAGATWLLWIALLTGALALLVYYERPGTRLTAALLGCALAAPVFAAAVLPFFGMAAPHYSWWSIFPFVLLVGKALAYLPRRVWLSVLSLLLIIPFLPLPTANFRYGNIFQTPFEDTFTWLEQHIEPGDVVYIDQSCITIYEKCGTAVEWDYYQMVYFADRRLQIVDSLAATQTARRVWYVHVDGAHDVAAEAAIAAGRVQSSFVGPWDFLWQLYEAPPDRSGIRFENGMRFHGFDVIEPRLQGGYAQGAVVRREGETLILRLWWSVDEPVAQDYSISTVIAAAPAAQALAQLDSPPQTISLFPFIAAPPPATSQWQPQQYYIEERVVALPHAVDVALRDTPLGIYMTVYFWQDGVPLHAPGVGPAGRLKLRDMFILTY